jgi:Putative metallopeptidase
MTPMKRLVTAATLVFAASALLSTAAFAQRPAVEPQRGKVTAHYIEPPYQHIYENLKRRRVLEELGEFLSPLKLKRDLALKTVQCGVVNAFYNPSDHSISMCYEMVAEFEEQLGSFVEGKLVLNRTIKLKPRVQNVTRAEAVVGAFVGVLLHETGHAVFDIQQIPRLGREEDSADQIAAFIMVSFGKDVARTTIKGTAALWDLFAQLEDIAQQQGKGTPRFDDVHSTSAQRLYNFLCIGYGADPAAFKDLVDQGLLPKTRADNCGNEYQQVRRAFLKTIMPFVDQDLMKQVQAKQWLRPEDLK